MGDDNTLTKVKSDKTARFFLNGVDVSTLKTTPSSQDDCDGDGDDGDDVFKDEEFPDVERTRCGPFEFNS